MSGSLCAVAVMRVSAVLRDCVDQLAVLGHIMSGTQRDTTAAAAAAAATVSEDISAVLEQQRAAEFHLKAARGGRVEAGGVTEAVQELHRTQRELERTLRDSTISSDSIGKVQSDRRFAAQLITRLLTELIEEGTFHSLIHTVEEEKRIKAQLQDIITSEEEDRLRIKTLQKELLDICKETTLQIQERDKMAAHLEDQLQEWKMKKSLQEKYMSNSTQLLVYQGQKLNNHNEKQLEAEIEMLKKKLKEEEKAHEELEVFLKNNQTSLEEKLEYWMERYDNDTEDKQRELNTLKTNKSNNVEQLQDLAKKYRDSEQVIIEDRLEKEKLRKQLEKEQLQRNAAIKIQSWWRGTLVRKGLGPFQKAKKPKQKKEGKKGKKKK
ncbi:dynein regulatory complex protein 9 [Pangasianodon hypophthalmus]|uniref:dynein regulatory complex protein 9 n=1 Tax=Pangasianodon hypophthalmus TaxID=310915 RepID=UPI002307A95D|nr:dynein regulatory complex protein 9 [Pangasianodon hypophthalmus]